VHQYAITLGVGRYADGSDLANHLLSQLATKHAMMASRGEDATSMVEQLIPRLLTAVLLQQDLHAVLQRIFGDESSRAIGESPS
jgi:glutamine synthetase adenylyltransferase